MMQLVPYSFDVARYPQHVQQPGTPGQVNGVYITLPPDYEAILSRVSGWFAEREEIVVVDHGVSDKVGLGYIVLEWIEHEVDQLFLAILRDEEAVADYTTYVRELEEV